MSNTIKFSNVYQCYLLNEPYHYPSIDTEIIKTGTQNQSQSINTGWHVIPNFLWRHFVTPKQWAQFIINNEAYCVKGLTCTLFNPIPITSNLSLQRINTFSAFNNCTYGICYTDECYETSFYPWNLLSNQYQLHLAQKEGITWYGPQGSAQEQHAAKVRYSWPTYWWQKPRVANIFDYAWGQGKTGGAAVFDNKQDPNAQGEVDSVALPNGIFWDPYNMPDQIGEFRAGKNSYTFSWNTHPCDEGKWLNTDQIAAFSHWTAHGPYCGVGRPGTHVLSGHMDPEVVATFGQAQKNRQKDSAGFFFFDDYTVPNFYNMPIVQTTWFWKEIQQSIIDEDDEVDIQTRVMGRWRKPDKYWPGTEFEAYKYPPWQWFCKGIPLFDEQSEQIKTSTHISVRVELTLEGKTRRSAYYCPTWGPMSGEQLYYSCHSRGIYQPNMIRYRTAGARNTWQNIQRPRTAGMTEEVNATWQKQHPREDVYMCVPTSDPQYVYQGIHRPAGIPDESARMMSSKEAVGKPAKRNIRVTFSRSSDQAEIHMDGSDED